MILACRGRTIDLSEPKIVGVLNVTPDSFYDGGKFRNEKAILAQAGKILAEGAAFIDVGGVSTRPRATAVSITEEERRVLPAIRAILKKFPEALISVDTFRAEVAEKAIAAGAAIINDVSAGDDDPKMFETVKKLGVPYIIMHKQGMPETMQVSPHYENVVEEIIAYLAHKLEDLRAIGVTQVVIDPGFGFGKTLEHNYEILKHLERFASLRVPLLVGLSRKSMIQKVVGAATPAEALNGTTAAHIIALMKGASLLRTHDVKEAVEAVKILSNVR